MHRCQIIKARLNQGKFPPGNLNRHNVKIMSPSHNNMQCNFYFKKRNSLKKSDPLIFNVLESCAKIHFKANIKRGKWVKYH